MDTDDLYISLYEGFSPTAEYLQADDRTRHLLAEGLIIAGLSFALKAFAEKFFEKLGESAAESVWGRIKGFFKTSADTGQRQAMLDGLALMGPYLSYLPSMTPAQRAVYADAVADALGARGYPRDIAAQVAADVVARLMAAGQGGSRP